ncbi:MAG: hypothetical protein F6K24_07495 [Okeania sp. SIO2D1]|nr:hypothetical protein [Okeania sp. SIO2D1]
MGITEVHIFTSGNDTDPIISLDTYGAESMPAAHVPEPCSTLSLLAVGTLGVVSTLKCKLKPSKSIEKVS